MAPVRGPRAAVWEGKRYVRDCAVSVRLQLATSTDVSIAAPNSQLASPSLRLSQFLSASPLSLFAAVHLSLNFPCVYFVVWRGNKLPVNDSKKGYFELSYKCVRWTFQQVLRISRKIAAVRYDNSDIAASAYTKMTMVSSYTFYKLLIQLYALFQSRVLLSRMTCDVTWPWTWCVCFGFGFYCWRIHCAVSMTERWTERQTERPGVCLVLTFPMTGFVWYIIVSTCPLISRWLLWRQE